MRDVKKLFLLERQHCIQEEGKTERSSVLWFPPQMALTAVAEPVQSHEERTFFFSDLFMQSGTVAEWLKSLS